MSTPMGTNCPTMTREECRLYTESGSRDLTPNPPTGRCNRNLVFDAATAIRNELYFFKNGYFWKTSGYFQGVMTKKVSTTWNGLRGLNQVDAAYEYKDKD